MKVKFLAMLGMIVMSVTTCFAPEIKEQGSVDARKPSRQMVFANDLYSQLRLYPLHEWLRNNGAEPWDRQNIVFQASANDKLKIFRVYGFDDGLESISQEFAIHNGEIIANVVFHGDEESAASAEELDAIKMDGLRNVYFAFQCSREDDVYVASTRSFETRYYVSLNAYSDDTLQNVIISGWKFSVRMHDEFQLYEGFEL